MLLILIICITGFVVVLVYISIFVSRISHTLFLPEDAAMFMFKKIRLFNHEERLIIWDILQNSRIRYIKYLHFDVGSKLEDNDIYHFLKGRFAHFLYYGITYV